MADIRPEDLVPATTVPIDAAIIIDNGTSVLKATPAQISGYVPVIVANAAQRTITESDVGHAIRGIGALTEFLIPDNVSEAIPVGFACKVLNFTAGSITIDIGGTDQLFWEGTLSEGQRTIPQRGGAVIHKVQTTQWLISGNGLT